MRIEFYKGGKLNLTENVKSWNHFEILVNKLNEGKYKLIIYKKEGKAVRSISIKNNQVFTKASEAPISSVINIS